MKPRLRIAAPTVLAAILASGCATAPPTPTPAAAVGIIDVIDGLDGYVIATFPNNQRMTVNVGKRELWRYRSGDEIRIDSFGRPLI